MKARLWMSAAMLAAAVLPALMSSCATEPKRRERVPPAVSDSTLPWNRPQKWEATSRYGSMMPQSR